MKKIKLFDNLYIKYIKPIIDETNDKKKKINKDNSIEIENKYNIDMVKCEEESTNDFNEDEWYDKLKDL